MLGRKVLYQVSGIRYQSISQGTTVQLATAPAWRPGGRSAVEREQQEGGWALEEWTCVCMYVLDLQMRDL